MDYNSDLQDWVTSSLAEDAEMANRIELLPLTGDAGFRNYFRVSGAAGRIAVHAPPAHENNLAFVEKGIAFRAAGVRVPAIIAVDFARGFMLQEDLGDDLLLPLLSPDTVDNLYQRAQQELLVLQQTPVDRQVFPAYDERQLRMEMDLFPEWFAGKLLGFSPDSEMRQVISRTFSLLVTEARQQPQVVVHRDYHSRNLLLLSGDHRIGVIDFQDAVIGPVTYDLVSLLKDCYIRWPADMVRQQALSYARQAALAGVIASVPDDQFLRWFDLMGLQRHIKVLGIFSRLWLRDGKERYLEDLPLVIRYTLETANRYPDTREFAGWFAERLLPRMQGRGWYRGEHLPALAGN